MVVDTVVDATNQMIGVSRELLMACYRKQQKIDKKKLYCRVLQRSFVQTLKVATLAEQNRTKGLGVGGRASRPLPIGAVSKVRPVHKSGADPASEPLVTAACSSRRGEKCASAGRNSRKRLASARGSMENSALTHASKLSKTGHGLRLSNGAFSPFSLLIRA
jgi:hypothetical protein